MIEGSGHGKDVVDGINACDRCYLMGKMCMIGTLEIDDSESRMNTNSILDSTSCSLAKECKRLCEDEIRINCVKSQIKYKNREENIKEMNILFLTR